MTTRLPIQIIDHPFEGSVKSACKKVLESMNLNLQLYIFILSNRDLFQYDNLIIYNILVFCQGKRGIKLIKIQQN